MNRMQLPLIAALAFFGTGATLAHANASSEALAACKAHVRAVHEGEIQTNVKRIRSRRSGVQIKLKVRANEDRFNAVCLVDRDGEVAYSTDLDINATAVVTK